jgi:uncharacterized protein
MKQWRQCSLELIRNTDGCLGRILARAIRLVYQRWLATRIKRHYGIICRFHPSCSEYAVLALQRHGAIKGVLLSRDRYHRCTAENRDTCFDFP